MALLKNGRYGSLALVAKILIGRGNKDLQASSHKQRFLIGRLLLAGRQ
jgi:hypothetical protein